MKINDVKIIRENANVYVRNDIVMQCHEWR